MSEAPAGSLAYFLPESGYPAHFPREGMVQSHHGLNNECPPELEENLRRSAWKLDQQRRILSHAAGQDCWVDETYGFRCLAENKACGSLVNPSAHGAGLGTDSVPNPALFTLRAAWDVLRTCDEYMGGPEPVDQLIIERGCIHTGLAVPWHGNKARGELRLDQTVDGVRTYPLFGIWKPCAPGATS